MCVKAENRMLTSFSKSLSLHIILVLKLCCEDSSMGGFCQDAIFGYLPLFHYEKAIRLFRINHEIQFFYQPFNPMITYI